MCFPEIPSMMPVLDLFAGELGLTLLGHVFSTPDNLNFFNNVRRTNADVEDSYGQDNYDPFLTGVPGLTGSPRSMLNSKIDQFCEALRTLGETEAWNWMEERDSWSTRQWLSSSEGGSVAYSRQVRGRSVYGRLTFR